MKNYTAIVERDTETQLYVGYVPGFAGAHSQAETLDELQENLREVIEMLLESVWVLKKCWNRSEKYPKWFDAEDDRWYVAV